VLDACRGNDALSDKIILGKFKFLYMENKERKTEKAESGKTGLLFF